MSRVQHLVEDVEAAHGVDVCLQVHDDDDAVIGSLTVYVLIIVGSLQSSQSWDYSSETAGSIHG